eukprot:12338024-Alexandrium_andersonii.AAC.1
MGVVAHGCSQVDRGSYQKVQSCRKVPVLLAQRRVLGVVARLSAQQLVRAPFAADGGRVVGLRECASQCQ